MNGPGPGDLQGVELLLVEDNPDDVELTLLTLAENRICNAVKVVPDGVAALDYVFGAEACAGGGIARCPNLILLDLKLPRLGGLEVLARLKQDPRTSKIPVVVLTSSREDPDIERCYALGVNSYIVKPVDFDQFRATIKCLGFYWQIFNVPPHAGGGLEPRER